MAHQIQPVKALVIRGYQVLVMLSNTKTCSAVVQQYWSLVLTLCVYQLESLLWDLNFL